MWKRLLLMTPERIDLIIHHSRWFLAIGLVVLASARALDLDFGIITAWMLMSLGVYGVTFAGHRLEPGTWMLAALFLAMSVFLYALFTFHSIMDFLQPAPVRPALGLVIDVSTATIVLGIQCRFLMTIVYENLMLTNAPRRRRADR